MISNKSFSTECITEIQSTTLEGPIPKTSHCQTSSADNTARPPSRISTHIREDQLAMICFLVVRSGPSPET